MVLQFSGLVTCGKGRAGGSVISSNNAGTYLFNLALPQQVTSSYNSQQQARFRKAAQFWSQLTNVERQSWNTAAALPAWALTNKCGMSYQPTGFDLFMQLNLNAFPESFTIRTAPAYPTFTSITFLSISATAPGTVIMNFSTGTIAATEEMIISATAMLTPGTHSPSPRLFKQIARVRSTSFATPLDISSLYLSRFPALVTGRKLFVKSALMNIASGARTDLGEQDVIVS